MARPTADRDGPPPAETTNLPVDRVAERAGFGTATSLRQHLQSAIDVSPMTYRRTFHTG
jgi:transcriptional regulator GlxA family with amidase domain